MTYKDFSSKFLIYKDDLYKLAYHFLGSQQDSEDILQDLFLKLWNGKELISTIDNPKGYCITLLKNMCIDLIRKRSRNITEELKVDIQDENSAIDTSIQTKERLSRVVHEINKLPQSQKTVLKLRILEDLSFKEISQQTGMTNSSLRVLLSNARKKLRQVL